MNFLLLKTKTPQKVNLQNKPDVGSKFNKMTKVQYFKLEEIKIIEKPTNCRFNNLDEKKYGRLKVVGYAGRKKNKTWWWCKCDCGNLVKKRSDSIISNHAKSCGCYQLEVMKKKGLIHGATSFNSNRKKLYAVWNSIKQRCLNENNKAYKYYGGRGIAICKEWANDFALFEKWSMTNGYRQGLSIDRVDNNKGYSPQNCRWATIKTQLNNTRSNRILEYNGVKKTVAQWSREVNISNSIIVNRLNRGWSVKDALTKSSNISTWIEYNGERLRLNEWAERMNIHRSTISSRLRYGWTAEQALTTPSNRKAV